MVLNSLKFKKAERDVDKLMVKLHPSLSESGYLPAQRLCLLKTISNVKISVEGLLWVNSEAAVNENITITGSVVGVQGELSNRFYGGSKKRR